jgi:hypothetical protein
MMLIGCAGLHLIFIVGRKRFSSETGLCRDCWIMSFGWGAALQQFCAIVSGCSIQRAQVANEAQSKMVGLTKTPRDSILGLAACPLDNAINNFPPSASMRVIRTYLRVLPEPTDQRRRP